MSLAINASNRDLRNVLVKFGQGAFFAHKAAAQTIATATTQQMTVDTEIVDVCSWFAANVFTPKVPGYYLLFASMFVTADTDFDTGEKLAMFIRKNGATPAYVVYSGVSAAENTKAASGTITQIVILEANGADTFDLAASHDDNGTISVSDVSFGGVLVSYNNP